MTVEGLDNAPADSSVCVDKVLDVVPKASLSASGSGLERSTGSTDGDMVFSSSDSAIKWLSDYERRVA